MGIEQQGIGVEHDAAYDDWIAHAIPIEPVKRAVRDWQHVLTEMIKPP
jgi:hypothetical protein